ncbi:MAG: orotidine-5'-phosphate decarboxylase [Flavobacteriaceae bacterium]
MARTRIDTIDRLIVALDVPSPDEARRIVEGIGPSARFYKIGMQLVFAGGLDLISDLVAEGKKIFLDMKLLDIGNTVEKGVSSIAGLGVHLTTIHAYPQAMRAAVKARGNGGLSLLGVTVLTSMDDHDLAESGYLQDAHALVEQRAVQAREAAMDGIVASPLEAERLRALIGDEMILVTPGVRPSWSGSDDQKRIATPRDAIRSGSDYLVVGRPVIAAADPREAATRIVDEIAAAE